MEGTEEKRSPKTYNTAIFAAFVVGFLLHAAITEEEQKLNDRITQDGLDLRDRIAALEKVAANHTFCLSILMLI